MSDESDFHARLDQPSASVGRIGKFIISGELLAQLLHLPDGVRIRRVAEYEHRAGDFVCFVEGGNVPQVSPGDSVPLLHPTFQRWSQPDGSWKTELQSW